MISDERSVSSVASTSVFHFLWAEILSRSDRESDGAPWIMCVMKVEKRAVKARKVAAEESTAIVMPTKKDGVGMERGRRSSLTTSSERTPHVMCRTPSAVEL